MPGLSLAAWCEELGNDPDREFILSGIENGFDIINDNAEFAPVNCDNHPSARPGSPLYGAATSQIIKEIECGNYIICDEVPKIVSPMGVIPKPDGDVRLIHDCSRPVGKADNDYCNVNWHQKFARVDDAAKFMSPGCYFAKVDLRSAYRSVNLSKASQEVTGLKWVLNGETVYLRDSKLPFGAKLSPGIFHRLTQAVKRIMARKGYDLLVVYLDDFLVISDSKAACAEALSVLIQLLQKFGFAIHWGKVIDPTTRITFLGVELDSLTMSLRLPNDKLLSLKQELQSFTSRKRATRRQLQSIAGRLSWAAGVVRGGRVFLRRIFNQISMLRHNSHRTLLTGEVCKDFLWWSKFLETFNGRSTVLEHTPIETVFTDACDEAAGGVFGGDWFHFNWSHDWPKAKTFHINEKEVIAVAIAAHRWAPYWSSKKIIVQSDNTVTVAAINKGTARNSEIMKCLRSLFWLSATHNFHLTAQFIPGIRNVAADSASRLHLPGYLHRLLPFIDRTPFSWHMSPNTYAFLIKRFPVSSG